jgi:hypothetical protein
MDDIKRFHGLYRGVVKSTSDPQGQRRIQVSVPQVTASEVTDWAYPVEPAGIHMDLPVIGQGVWISYIGGDPEHPIWHGAFGKNQGKNKQVNIKALNNTVTTTGYTNVLSIENMPDGTQELDLTGSVVNLAKGVLRFVSSSPNSPTSTGTKGDFAYGSQGSTHYVYFCVSTNTWVRVAVQTSSWT